MNKLAKASITVVTCIVLTLAFGYWLIGNPFVFLNNYRLKKSIQSIDGETTSLRAVVPFAWDALYTFEPYQSKEEIEGTIGFKSADIKENMINEGMVHLLFVKEERVVASILGYGENLGYRIDFASRKGGKITLAENAQFRITKTDGVTTLTYIKQA